jgi:hypothetical protein
VVVVPIEAEVTIAGMGYALEDRRWTEAFSFFGAESLLGHDIIVWDVASSLGYRSSISSTDIERREASSTSTSQGASHW